MPDYNSSQKIKARSENIAVFRKLTGQQSVPKHRQFWTLCNRQPQNDRAEIMQLVNSGFLTKEQFHGVDRDEEIIKNNAIWHPTANWHYGDWMEVVQSFVRLDQFNPAMVYLDTTSFADHFIASNMVLGTMMLCPPNTLLLANLMLNDPRSSNRFDPTKLIHNINHQIPPQEISKWRREVINYRYNITGKTEMQTYILFRE